MSNRNSSVAFVSPVGKLSSSNNENIKLYNEEKAAIKKSFEGMSVIDWRAKDVQDKLDAIAKQVITRVTNTAPASDLVSLVLPTEDINPGETFVLSEVYGGNIYYSTYGASVRMSRPQFTKYSATTNTKEVGIKLELTQIANGKYSPSELGEYISNLVTAWKNRLLFSTTLTGMTAYQSGGAQYQTGATLSQADMLAGIAKLTDEADAKMLIGRRAAIHKLLVMTNSNWSDNTLDEIKRFGMVGMYMGIPVMKVNSWTDKEYGTVSPFGSSEFWIFSDLEAGRYIREAALRTSQETVLQNETLNIYFRWADGIGIFWNNRIVRIAGITS